MNTALPPGTTTVLEATSIGLPAKERLRTSEGGVVDGAFDGAINVRLDGGMVCVVPEAAGMGPLNVVLRLPAGTRDMATLGLRRGDAVRVRGSSLELGECRVELGSALVYSPAIPRRRALSDEALDANLEAARRTAIRFGKMAGLGGLLPLLGPSAERSTATKLNLFASAALGRILALEGAFRSKDGDRMDQAVEDLVGLGPGLTPSSDDVLAGIALFCALYSRSRGARAPERMVSRAIAAHSRGRTTRLSEEFLSQAALGNGNEAAMRLCGAVLTADPGDVEERTRAVLTIGETSGTDIVLGVVLGGMLCIGRPVGLDGRGP